MRTDKENIKAYILTQIGRGEKRYAAKTVEAFGVSKASVYSYVKELESDGIILKNGNREYVLASESHSFHYKTADHPDESRLLRRDVSPLMNSLPLNVRDIWDYAVSEMLNNAIEHASAENIRLTVTMDALNTTVSITDDGVGIFRHIHDYIFRETGEDLLPEECASLLLAGKFTTARDRHSGEGIFFTSHMMDRFVIVSGGTRFEREYFEDVQSWIPDLGGTGVFMQLSNTTKKTVREIFDRFSSVDEGFYRTQIPIPLAVIEYLIERARADELDEARERFGIARADSDSPGQGIEVQYEDDLDGDDYENDNGEEDEYDSNTADSDDDEDADDLDEDDESDYGYDDDGEEVYDEEDDYDPDDDDNQESGPVMSM